MTEAPKHLLGELDRISKKCERSMKRMGRGRMHRPVFWWHKATGSKVIVGNDKWQTVNRKWQHKFGILCERLSPYDVFKPFDIATLIALADAKAKP